MSYNKFLKVGTCLLPAVVVAAVSIGGLMNHVPDYRAIQNSILGSFASVSSEEETMQAADVSDGVSGRVSETAEPYDETAVFVASTESVVSEISSAGQIPSVVLQSSAANEHSRLDSSDTASSEHPSDVAASVSDTHVSKTNDTVSATPSREESMVSRPTESSRAVSTVSRPVEESHQVPSVSHPSEGNVSRPTASPSNESSRPVSPVSRPAEQSRQPSAVSQPMEENHQPSTSSQPTEPSEEPIIVSEPSVPQEPVSEEPMGRYRDGVYTASTEVVDDSPQEWFIYTLQVTVKVMDGAITSVSSTITWDADGEQSDNGHYVLAANRSLSGKIVEQQGTDGIDIVSGATYSSRGILSAAAEAIRQAEQ